jgi:hypothetical protein
MAGCRGDHALAGAAALRRGSDDPQDALHLLFSSASAAAETVRAPVPVDQGVDSFSLGVRVGRGAHLLEALTQRRPMTPLEADLGAEPVELLVPEVLRRLGVLHHELGRALHRALAVPGRRTFEDANEDRLAVDSVLARPPVRDYVTAHRRSGVGGLREARASDRNDYTRTGRRSGGPMGRHFQMPGALPGPRRRAHLIGGGGRLRGGAIVWALTQVPVPKRRRIGPISCVRCRIAATRGRQFSFAVCSRFFVRALARPRAVGLLTRERSLVRNQPRPSRERPQRGPFCWSGSNALAVGASRAGTDSGSLPVPAPRRRRSGSPSTGARRSSKPPSRRLRGRRWTVRLNLTSAWPSVSAMEAGASPARPAPR